ncbi:NIPSNAP family protein [Isoptericola sp. NPDC056573]|uniref:NIPSNAP family protein n=1 Tax=Isoptericola sp. NPDC056573 TaxID=3345868 RepID=UPI00367AF625
MTLVSRPVRCPVVELRQYTLHPGRRDDLVDLFERELLEPQEAAGMTLLGQFRDLDHPDRFVWLRGFDDMTSRARALAEFYDGPVWRAHRDRANATMVDSDDVLLLRPTSPSGGFPVPPPRRASGEPAPVRSTVVATVWSLDGPLDDAPAEHLEQVARPLLAGAGVEPVASLRTEHAANTFPALPVRAGEEVLVSLVRHDADGGAERLARLESSARWREEVLTPLAAASARPVQRLRLAPTPRSSLR